jgi:glycosyltransferase involved in cell wall biosynthesis
VGSYDARKNVLAMVKALPTIMGQTPTELHLVGFISEKRKNILTEVAKALPQHLRMHVHGLVDEAALMAHYAAAHFFVFPSLFEGFGSPVMEAMSMALPVFAFRNSSLPEIAGDAACLAVTGDFAAWGERLRQVLLEPEAYGEWAQKATQRAENFTEAAMRDRYVRHWQEFAQQCRNEAAKVRT